jgi:hypothetical protein
MSFDTDFDVYDAYYGSRSRQIPILPPVLEGRTYFNKARDRERAMKEGRASEPVGSETMILKRVVEPVTHWKRKVRYHWDGNDCNNRAGWGAKMKARVLDGAAFSELHYSSQCQMCRAKFLKA